MQVSSRWREECLKREYQQQCVTFDEWRSAREEKGRLITTDKPWGETNTDLSPSRLMTTPTNTFGQPTSCPTIVLDTGRVITPALWVHIRTLSNSLSPPIHPSESKTWCRPPIGLCLAVNTWLEAFKLKLYCNLQSVRAKHDSTTIVKLVLTDNTWKGVTSLSMWHDFSFRSPCIALGFNLSLPCIGKTLLWLLFRHDKLKQRREKVTSIFMKTVFFKFTYWGY